MNLNYLNQLSSFYVPILSLINLFSKIKKVQVTPKLEAANLSLAETAVEAVVCA